MLNMLSTDLVVIVKPSVIRNYADIQRREDVRTLFYEGWADSKFFKDAKPGTDEYEVWKKSYIMKDFSVGEISKVWQPVIDQKILMVAREWLCATVANLGLTKMRELGHNYIRALKTKDEKEKRFTNSHMMQKDAPMAFKSYISKR